MPAYSFFRLVAIPCRYGLLLWGLGFLGALLAQPAWQWEPSFSYTHTLTSYWSVNARVVSMQRRAADPQADPRYSWDRIELAGFATYRLLGGKKLSLGYTQRRLDPLEADGGWENRITQQFAFVSYVGGQRIGHRLRSEQRFRPEGLTQRFRYRLSYDVPLNGEKLDPGESYLFVSEAVHLSLGARQAAANRVYVAWGHRFGQNQKLEIGLEHRWEGLGTGSPSHFLHLVTAWYLSRQTRTLNP
ncbi:MAG: DUF2490 domain-containing protein [Bacteroidetes bacterium]|nr:MAG: DUF2490 domain-containing protein [Bacteroidota bacterium]